MRLEMGTGDDREERRARPRGSAALQVLVLVLAGCTGEAPPPPAVRVATDLGASLARPILNEFAAAHEVVIDQTRVDQGAVLWQRDPETMLRLAADGALAPLPAAAVGERPPLLVDRQRRWAASAAVARVLVSDPQQLADAEAPTRVLDLARPGMAARLVLADPTSGTAVWHAAALCGRLGMEPCTAFFADLRSSGAQVVADEDAVVAALAAGTRPLALIDSDRAYAAQAALPRLVITIPDQEANGSGAFVLPWPVALRAGAAGDRHAAALASYLLAPAQAYRIALAANALEVAGAETPAGMLKADALKLMDVSYDDLLDRLPAVRAALGK
jgi:ABC-type Fe3+ transport system substrate-binding protein